MPDYMLQEIKEQPTILHRLIKRQKVITDISAQIESFNHIYLTGCGDPYFAALTSRYIIEHLTTRPTYALPSMDYRGIKNNLTTDSLVIVSSVSGRTNRTIEAAKAAQEAGAITIGITDNIESSITDYCTFVIETGTSPQDTLNKHDYAGYQYVVPQTKTYTAVLFVQMALGIALAAQTRDNLSILNQHLNSVDNAVQKTINALERPLMEMGAKYAEKQVTILGSGPYFGLAKYGGAKFLEFAIPSYSQCLEEFNHQEVFLADENWLIVLLAPDPLSYQRVRELAPLYGELGSKSLVFASEPYNNRDAVETVTIDKYPDVIAPFVYAIPLQLLAFFIAKAKGLEIDEWCGGNRTEQIVKLSQKTIRASKII